MKKNKNLGGITEKYNLAFAFFLIAVVFILILNIFSLDFFSKDDEEGVKKIYFADHISTAHLELIERFNEKYKDEIKVIPIDLPWSKFNTNQRKELIARTLRSEDIKINIYAVDQIWVGRFEKWAEPLDEYFSESEKSRILPQLKETCIINDKLVCIPMYCDIGILAYKKSVLKQIPGHEEIEKKLRQSISWEELIEFIQTSGKGANSYLFQGDAYEGLICNLYEIYASKYNLDFPQTREEILDEKFKNSIQFLKDLIYKYEISPKEVTKYAEKQSYDNFFKKKSLFVRRWFTGLRDYKIYNREPHILDDLTPCPLPHFGDGDFKTVFGGWNLMIVKSSQNKEEAVKFLKFVLEEKTQEYLYHSGYYLPVISSCYNDTNYFDYYDGFPLGKYIRNNTIHRPNYSEYTKRSDILSYYINMAIRNEYSIEEALEKACDNIFDDKLFIK